MWRTKSGDFDVGAWACISEWVDSGWVHVAGHMNGMALLSEGGRTSEFLSFC